MYTYEYTPIYINQQIYLCIHIYIYICRVILLCIIYTYVWLHILLQTATFKLAALALHISNTICMFRFVSPYASSPHLMHLRLTSPCSPADSSLTSDTHRYIYIYIYIYIHVRIYIYPLLQIHLLFVFRFVYRESLLLVRVFRLGGHAHCTLCLCGYDCTRMCTLAGT